jgi:hypothetical protein
MATRFDRVTTPVRVREPGSRQPTLGELDLEVRELVRLSREPRTDLLPPSTKARQLPTRPLAVAMTVWLSTVFAACYVGLPLLLAMTGLNQDILTSSIFSFPAFVMASFVAVVGASIARPEIRLDVAGRRDPVLSATIGGLGVWALVHNTSDLLVPFSAMTGPELISFVGLNVVEMVLLGMMFASFTRSKAVALVLGGGFQMLVLGLVLTLLKLALL